MNFLIRLKNQFLTFKSNSEHGNAPTNNLLALTRFKRKKISIEKIGVKYRRMNKQSVHLLIAEIKTFYDIIPME